MPIVPDLTIAGYAVPLILTVIMGVLFKFIPVVPDRFKAVLTVAIAIVLAIVAMYYSPHETITFRTWVDTILGGIMIGASAIGVYELQRTVSKPRV